MAGLVGIAGGRVRDQGRLWQLCGQPPPECGPRRGTCRPSPLDAADLSEQGMAAVSLTARDPSAPNAKDGTAHFRTAIDKASCVRNPIACAGALRCAGVLRISNLVR